MFEGAAAAKISGLTCLRCGAQYPADFEIDSKGCPACRDAAPSNLEISYGADALAQRKPPAMSIGGLAAFADYLPVDVDDLVTLGEGGTPLVQARQLGKALGIDQLVIKDESRNPSCSHKDRFSAVAVSHARRQGLKFIATASSGNAGASLAAYTAKAGMKCLVVTFEGAAGPVVEQIRRYGALVVELKDKMQRWPILAEGVERFGWFVTSPFAAPVVGSHPFGIEGYKTAAYEIVAQSEGSIPDWVIVPAAYGDLLRGIWRGFKDLHQAGHIDRLPKIAAAEIYGSVHQTLAEETDRLAIVEPGFDTQALSIGTLQGTYQSVISVRESQGAAEIVEDDALWTAQRELAHREGIFGELSGVAAVAAAGQMRRKGVIGAGESVVCVMTASGLKDIDQQPKQTQAVHKVEGGLDDVLEILSAEFGSEWQQAGSGAPKTTKIRETQS